MKATKEYVTVLVCFSGLSGVVCAQPIPTYVTKPFTIANHIVSVEKDEWQLGANAWRYHSTQNMRLTLGQHQPTLGSGLAVAPVGGLSVSKQQQGFLGLIDKTPWRYGLTLGKVDQNVGGLQLRYGAAVGRAWADIELSPTLKLDGIYQQSHNYQQVGVGTQLDGDSWGKWSLSLAQSQLDTQTGWRYQGRYGVDLSETVHLSWNTDTYVGTYTKLTQIQGRKNTTPQQEHGVNVQWDSTVLGKVGANYANQIRRYGANEQSLGISQQFWYSPNLRVDIDAQREKHSGDYNMGLRFSMPIF